MDGNSSMFLKISVDILTTGGLGSHIFLLNIELLEKNRVGHRG